MSNAGYQVLLSATALVTCALLAAPVHSSETATQASLTEDLTRRALALELDTSPRWLALIHYEKRTLGRGFVSAVKSPTFFVSDDGPTDPRAELLATLHSFARPDVRVRGGEQPHCAFPARALWLTEELGLPPDQFSRGPCPALEAWRRDLRPRALTLVFPEAFMNQPASMFGHTLLRIDVSEEDAPENLLAYAIDFTADTGGESGPLYLLKGALGFYPGRFGVNPYYQKLKLYADWQNRDIWEYQLTLQPAELELVLLHLWELRHIEFAYYFFDENCSYQLLRLLEAARPGIRLHDGFPLAVVPVDTVRAVVGETGLAAHVRYRPSPARELRWSLRSLPAREQRLARALARGDFDPEDERVRRLAETERAAMLSAAYDILRYAYLSGKVGEEESRSRSYRILVQRSRLVSDAGPEIQPGVPVPRKRPEEGHGTAMVAVAGGWRDEEPYLELRLRPALHERMDPGGGYADDSAIRILDTRVRYFPELERARLEELILLDLRSESPRDRFFKPISWHVDTGLRTRLFPRRDSEHQSDLNPEPVWRTAGGAGLAYSLAGSLKLYGFADATAEVGSAFKHDAALGPGASAGLKLTLPSDCWKGHLFGKVTHFVLGDTDTDVSAGVEQRLTLSRQTALRANVVFHHFSSESWLDVQLALQWFF